MLKKILSILISISILSGCGFKLQGLHKFPDYMHTIVIAAGDNYDPFSKLLIDSFKTNEINVISTRPVNTQEFVILEANTPKVSEQIHSYDSKGQVSQYRLVATLFYKLLDHQGKILKQNVINRSRTYSWSSNRVLSSSNEQQIINEELNIEIVNELLRQLANLNGLPVQDDRILDVPKSPC